MSQCNRERGGKYQVGIIVESIDFWASCVQNVFFFFKKQKFKQTNPTKYVAEAVAAIKCQYAKALSRPNTYQGVHICPGSNKHTEQPVGIFP